MVRVGINELCAGWLILKDGLMLRVVVVGWHYSVGLVLLNPNHIKSRVLPRQEWGAT